MSSDASNPSDLPGTSSEPTPNSPQPPPESDVMSEQPTDEGQSSAQKRRILIGSQRDPAAYRVKPKRDWTPLEEEAANEEKGKIGPDETPPAALPVEAAVSQPSAPAMAETPAPPVVTPPPMAPLVPASPPVVSRPVASPVAAVAPPAAETLFAEKIDDKDLDDEVDTALPAVDFMPRGGGKKFPPPNIRGQLSPDLEDEFLEALGDTSMDAVMGEADQISKQALLEPESMQTGRIVAVHREDVFVELGGREQGVVPLVQFAAPPEEGQTIQVRVNRFNPAEGLYELSLPHAAAQIGDWSDINEGMLVEAHVTAHNTGGLECEVNHIRGFIPVSQIALYRVENLEDFVGQNFTCVVVEANPERRNLVLSRRAVLERENEEARKVIWETLAIGQVREGVVRKLMDFGAFVDLGGGVDGLLHISQLAWGRVKHPRDVVQEGQVIKVRVDKIDPETRRIGLSYRDLMQSPWTDAANKYPQGSTVHGRATKLMEFGAFVELEPGVEGLVHISELSHKRVFRVSDVVKEGDEVDAVVLSIDPVAKRISLSMKSLVPGEEPAKEPEPETAEPEPEKKPKTPTGPLRGGLGKGSGGDQFGLKW